MRSCTSGMLLLKEKMLSTNSKRIAAFRRLVWRHYREHGRHDLPWRKTTNPYKILVSEVMLQQTQVSRVIEKYKEFLKTVSTIKKLADASLSDVLKVWSGMGYNRRAKFLREAAKAIAEEQGCKVPRDFTALHALPGVGPYTTSAVGVFAYNEPDILIETNIRAAFIHHFYSSVLQKTRITDKEMLPLVRKAAEGQDPRTWHWALMDYGAYLKKSGVRNNHKSAQYTKQSKFEGSLRQVRGAILRELQDGSSKLNTLPFEKEKIERALASLSRDGLIKRRKGKWVIS